ERMTDGRGHVTGEGSKVESRHEDPPQRAQRTQRMRVSRKHYALPRTRCLPSTLCSLCPLWRTPLEWDVSPDECEQDQRAAGEHRACRRVLLRRDEECPEGIEQ